MNEEYNFGIKFFWECPCCGTKNPESNNECEECGYDFSASDND